ncbi:response regulator [Rhodovulum sulfidophilum]|uniref:response regulator n=1 Tax=Rhodovulum sulfidophilum TaxID=35806 RepID=UPI001E4212CB|nr:response regulator [Rhodovulum sulfidophilum]MCE8431140.1 response regulator [Rhodovulum sulfidophilum]MCF4117541.1 response regulator [Rhodovulum sulfidophilum]MCW2304520.1 CheY-like chemotaxis protein [Rhodovulum sulfidophilum]
MTLSGGLHEKPDAPASKQKVERMAQSAPTCLVVEDTAFDRMIMERKLAAYAQPLQVRFVSTLAEARNCLSEMPISIIFLDNSLPDGKGANFALELAAHRNWMKIPVVMVSDWPSPFMPAKAKAANVVAIWTKTEFTALTVAEVLKSRGLTA